MSHPVFLDARRAVALRRLCGSGQTMAIAGAARYLLRPRHTILFAPHRPMQPYIFYKLCIMLGYRIETDWRRSHDIVFRFRDATFDETPLPVAPGVRTINANARDVSKRRVQHCWEAVAGYPLRIDPFRHVGPAVCKADANGAHDGRIVHCPVDVVEPGCVYERLVESTTPSGTTMLYRVPVHGDVIPMVYVKHRPRDGRFAAVTVSIELDATGNVFTAAEQATLVRFARAMDLDVCEMDVMRDVRDGRIYGVDVNHTPFGPPGRLPTPLKARALGLLAESFRRFIEVPAA